MTRGRFWSWAANTATLLNAVCGAAAIAYVLLGNKPFALFLILAGVGFDGLDGLFHRRSGQPSKAFGRIADSCADAVTFCLAPGVALAFDNYPLSVWSSWTDLGYLAGAAVAVVGLARLYHFTTVAYTRPNFSGASTPQNAMWVVLLLLLFQIPGFFLDSPLIVYAAALAFAPLMVLPIAYPKARRGSPLRSLTGAMAGFLSLGLIVVNLRARLGWGREEYDLAYAASAVAFVLLLAFYALGPIVARTPASGTSPARKVKTPKVEEEKEEVEDDEVE